MRTPSADSFTALARSSPWLWTTLRFTVERRHERAPEPVRAWLGRPDRLRVETLDGKLLQMGREPRAYVQGFGPSGLSSRPMLWPSDAGAPVPDRRPDGLIAVRPDAVGLDFDDPLYADYFWVAMLDPAELADGRDPDAGLGPSPLEMDGVGLVEHAGRPAWEAVVQPTAAYSPRCSCCSLLRSRDVDLDGPNDVLVRYPDAVRVRLDVETGVCVRTEEIGGLTPGAGHDLRIEAVDEPMPDALFSYQ